MHTTPPPVCRQAATSYQRARCLKSNGSRRKTVMHSPEEFSIRDPDSKPQQVNATTISAAAAPEKSCITEMFADCPTSSLQSESSSPSAEVKHKAPTICDRVLMLGPADQHTVNAPFTVTRGTKQVQTSLESTTFDPSGRTLLSVHLMLVSEQQIRPDLTLEKLKLELKGFPHHYQKNGTLKAMLARARHIRLFLYMLTKMACI